MTDTYIISIDQSTQGTKALLFDREGRLLCRADRSHRQIINEAGWVSHDPEEIYENTIQVIKDVVKKGGIDKNLVAGIGISNQRETSLIWDRSSGKPLADAVVWQCARALEICERPQIRDASDMIFEKTGLKLSPYFPASKIAWLLENADGAASLAQRKAACHGTMDSYLVFRLTGGREYRTDYSNASRTQLFNIHTLDWDEEICRLFGIRRENLPCVTDSDACFGMTNCEGFFTHEIPIHAVLGDSHAALFGQNCCKKGQTKATYGTGSSIMMNIGDKPVLSTHGVVTSLAWSRGGKAEYVLEGNLNYTGAVITWLKDDMKMIQSPGETQELAQAARKDDNLYLIPAFTGLGAPYWDSHARAALVGMDRTSGRNEMVRAGLECIAYQICDIVRAMEDDANLKVSQLRVDGGPTKNSYLMQFQTDILNSEVAVPSMEELSGIGAAYMAGIAMKIWDEKVFFNLDNRVYQPKMRETTRQNKLMGWKNAVQIILK